MKEAMVVALEDAILYNGNSALLFLFFTAMIFLWFFERDRNIRMVLIYVSISLVMVFFCPLYAWIGQKIDEEIYYRVFWTLPIGILFCYGSVCLLMKMKRVVSRVLVGIMLILVICVNGKFVYKNTIFIKATNAYHIPQIAIDVVESIEMKNYRPNVALPAELLPFIRQYSGNILTPYGRNILVERWNFNNSLYDAMEADVYDAEEIALQARNAVCEFVVLSTLKEMNGSMEEQNYFLKECVNGIYNVYMDCSFYEIMKESDCFEGGTFGTDN